MTRLFKFAFILLSLLLPVSAYSGTIRTSITTSQRVTSQGTIELDFKIRNRGDVTAHKVVFSLILAGVVRSYASLGDNPPGEEIRVKETLADLSLRPGKYWAVVRVGFEEQTGKVHHVYHFFEIPYFTDRMRSPGLPLSLETIGPCFNKKAFWDKSGAIRLSMKNEGTEDLRLNSWLFLPEGVTSPEPNRSYALSPGETRMESVPVHMEPDMRTLRSYHLIVWCVHDQTHYSWDLKGTIRVQDQPVYFKGYVVAGMVLLALLFGALLVRNRRTKL